MLRIMKKYKGIITQSDIPLKTKFFTNFQSEEGLPLEKIIEEKKILSLKIKYLSDFKLIKAPGFLGKLGLSVYTQKKLEIVISDPKGIEIHIDPFNNNYISILLRNSKEYIKIINNCDQKSIRTYENNNIHSPRRFRLDLNVEQILSILWKEK